jgi:hypothetical protein
MEAMSNNDIATKVELRMRRASRLGVPPCQPAPIIYEEITI